MAWFGAGRRQMVDPSSGAPLDWATLTTVLWQTQFGRLWLGRLALGGALAVALVCRSPHEAVGTSPAAVRDGLPFALASLLLISLAWAGHAAAGLHLDVLHLTADILHLFLGALWPMGLFPLAIFYAGRGEDPLTLRRSRP